MSVPGAGRALVLAALVLLAGCASGHSRGLTGAVGGAGAPGPSAGEVEALLAPLWACDSPAAYVAAQRRVDMPRLVEALDDWRAVRLGTMGPVRADAAEALQDKRAAFLVAATERYGLAYAEVFALFVLHSAHDDEVDGVLRRLARDRRLGSTLGLMPAVRAELEARGLPLSAYPERAEQAGDVARGLGRAARDALSTSPLSEGLRYAELAERRGQLPEPYRRALDAVERELAWRHFAPGRVAVGGFDALTFGVPLGFAYLVAGTAQGLGALAGGRYEQAAHELAPAALWVGLYAGGRGVRVLPEASLRELGRQWEARLGGEGVRELFHSIRARREAGEFVVEGGLDAALALSETRGDVARAQVWLSQAKPPGGGASGHEGARRAVARAAAERPSVVEPRGGGVLWVDEPAGLSLEDRLARAELEAPGARLSREVAVLERQRPSVGAPPPGAEGDPRWSEYVAYRERRLGELRKGEAVEGPLRWEGYERMRVWFARGMAFEQRMVDLLRADAARPRAERLFLGDFERPRIERSVGVWKPGSGLRFADVLVLEEGGASGAPPRVETFSFKSRDFSELEGDPLSARMIADAREALEYYGETLDIRRPSLQGPLRESSPVLVRRVRLLYEGGPLKPKKINVLSSAVSRARRMVPGVEVDFQ